MFHNDTTNKHLYAPPSKKRKEMNSVLTGHYCCLQVSFLGFCFFTSDFSACRFVGGMKVGSSRKSWKPEGDMGGDPPTGPVPEGDVWGYCYRSMTSTVAFPVESTWLSSSVSRVVPPGLKRWVQLLCDVSDLCVFSEIEVVSVGVWSSRWDVWWIQRWLSLRCCGCGAGWLVLRRAVFCGGGKAFRVKSLSLDLRNRQFRFIKRSTKPFVSPGIYNQRKATQFGKFF